MQAYSQLVIMPSHKHQLESSLSRCGFKIIFTPPGIGFGQIIFAEDESKRKTGSCGSGLTVEMFGETPLKVDGEANI